MRVTLMTLLLCTLAQVGSYKTDKEILTPLFERLDPDITGVTMNFIEATR